MKFKKFAALIAFIALAFSLSPHAYAGYWQDQYSVYQAQGNTTGMAIAHAGAVASGSSNCPSVAVTYTGTIPSTPSWATTDNNVATSYSAAVTLLQSRGYAVTQTNISAAEQELSNYTTSNSIIGAGSTVTGGTMEEAGVTYTYNAATGKWVASHSYDDSLAVSQSYLNQIAAYRLAWQNAQAAKDTTLMNAINNQANTLRSSSYGYTSGTDGAYLLSYNSSGGSTSSTTTSNDITYYTITSSSEGRGSISPSGNVSVAYLGSQAYTITPLSGYKISDVKVDGTSVGTPSTYSFYDVTASHTIVAYFVSNITLSFGNISISGLADNGTIKSGYGFGVSVPVYTNGTLQAVVVKITNGSKVTTYNMETTDGTNYHLPVNSASVSGARVYYVPVSTADDTKVYISVSATVAGDSSSGVTYTTSANTSAVTVATERYTSTKAFTCYPSMSVDSSGNIILSGMPVVVSYSNISSYQGYYWKDDATGAVYKLGSCYSSTGGESESTAVTVATETGTSTKTFTCYPKLTSDALGNPVLSGTPVIVNSANIGSYQGYYWQDSSTGTVYKVGSCNTTSTANQYTPHYGDAVNISLPHTSTLTMYPFVDVSSGTPKVTGDPIVVALDNYYANYNQYPYLYYTLNGSVYYVTYIPKNYATNSVAAAVGQLMTAAPTSPISVTGGTVSYGSSIKRNVAPLTNPYSYFSALSNFYDSVCVNGSSAVPCGSAGSMGNMTSNTPSGYTVLGKYVSAGGNTYMVVGYSNPYLFIYGVPDHNSIFSYDYFGNGGSGSYCSWDCTTSYSSPDCLSYVQVFGPTTTYIWQFYPVASYNKNSFTWQFYPVTADYISNAPDDSSLTKSLSAYVLVEGNMYQDDYTGDN